MDKTTLPQVLYVDCSTAMSYLSINSHGQKWQNPQRQAELGSPKQVRMRWTYQGKEHHLALGLKDTPYNRGVEAEKLRKAIQRDIEEGGYDPTLEKYKARLEKYNPQESKPESVQLTTDRAV